FAMRSSKLKFDILGRKVKGDKGNVLKAREAGYIKRKDTLLKEHQASGKSNAFVDRRFGEDDASMTPEERAIGRLARTRLRQIKRGSGFNLNDDDDDGQGYDDEEPITLTHGGKPIDEREEERRSAHAIARGRRGMRDDDSDDDMAMDAATTGALHFGGGEDDDGFEPTLKRGDHDTPEENGDPNRRKTKKEVMDELIDKSKYHKAERARQRERDEDLLDKLDDEFKEISGAGLFRAALSKGVGHLKPDGWERDDYDKLARELALESRGQATDRIRTQEEVDAAEAATLETAERARLKRMNASDEDDDDDEEDEDEEEDADDDEEDNDDEEAKEAEEAGEEKEELDFSGDKSDSDLWSDSEEQYEEGEPKPAKAKDPKAKAPVPELPFTFPMPETPHDLEKIVGHLSVEDTTVALERIRKCHAPTLKEDNRKKMQSFLGLLLQRFEMLSGQSPLPVDYLDVLAVNIAAVANIVPFFAVTSARARLEKMAARLRQRLRDGETGWPPARTILLISLFADIFPTTDKQHPVSTPAALYLGNVLAHCAVRSTREAVTAVVVAGLAARYSAPAGRIFPEAITLL
ncbi:predicted protein, partial [Micromonas commoda]